MCDETLINLLNELCYKGRKVIKKNFTIKGATEIEKQIFNLNLPNYSDSFTLDSPEREISVIILKKTQG